MAIVVDYDSQVLLIPVEMQFFHADLRNLGESLSTPTVARTKFTTVQ